MQYYYGDNNILRALDEAEFWKHQESEHPSVIIAVTPGLEKGFVKTLQDYANAFQDIHGYLVRYTESVVRAKNGLPNTLHRDVLRCIQFCVRQSEDFVTFLDKMTRESEAAQKNKASQAVIRHIIRESQYFIGIDQLLL